VEEGPQESSEGRAATRSAIEIGAILQMNYAPANKKAKSECLVIVGFELSPGSFCVASSCG